MFVRAWRAEFGFYGLATAVTAPMKTIDRYVLTKTLGPLFACIAIALIAMLLERMLRLLDFMLDKGGPFFMVLKMLANLIPHYLGLANSRPRSSWACCSRSCG